MIDALRWGISLLRKIKCYLQKKAVSDNRQFSNILQPAFKNSSQIFWGKAQYQDYIKKRTIKQGRVSIYNSD